MLNFKPFYVEILAAEFKKKLKKNASFSVRAFARHLGVDPSSISRILSRKQGLSVHASAKIVNKLEIEKNQRRLFLQSVVIDKDEQARKYLGEKIDAPFLRQNPVLLNQDQFKEIAHLDLCAIMQTAFLKDASADPAWIAQKIGSDPQKVQAALRHLSERGFIEIKDEKIVNNELHITTQNKEMTSAELKQYQREVIEGSLKSLDLAPLERRNATSMTMAIDLTKIPQAKIMIQNFMEDLCDFLENGERTEIYQLGIQMYPLSQELGK